MPIAKRIAEIKTRKAEIRSLLESNDKVDIDALDKELRDLNTEQTELERRQSIAAGIASGELIAREIPNPVNSRNAGDDFDQEKEYRSAWLKNIRNLGLTANEQRAMAAANPNLAVLVSGEQRAMTTAAASVGAVVPTVTVNKIIEKVKEFSPMLEEIELVHIPGDVTLPAEGTTTDAAKHSEGSSITAGADTVGKVSLSHYELTKLITISKSVELMSVDAFETYLVNKLARKIAEKAEAYVINGSGSSEPEGINAITFDATNSVTVGVSASLTEANVQTLVGLFNKGYSKGAKWLMSSQTFFSDFHPLMNSSKNNVVTCENGVYRILGFPILWDERQALHTAILGNLKMGYVGNMPEEVTVTSQFVVRENSYDFLGSALFDGKVQAVEAFVKLKKAST